MEMAENLPRVGLIGGNGTGKTLMLETFATKIAKKFPNENVIFAIQQLYNSSRPLLKLQMELAFEHYKNVSVIRFKTFYDLLQILQDKKVRVPSIFKL